MAYVEQAAFDLYVQSELTGVAADTALRTVCLAAAEIAVNDFCKRSFAVAGSATARTYAPNGSDVVRIHDCTTVTALTYDSVAVSASDYQLEPLNAISWSGAARPYEQVRRLTGLWPAGVKALVSVTATWGWAAVPSSVVEATMIIGKDILQQRRTSGNMIAVGDIAGTVRLNTYVKRLLSPLRRVEAFGFA